MTDSQTGSLCALAGFLRREQVRLTERWMQAVAADADLIEADRLTWEQLADHLPAILSGICVALEEQDFQPVERAIERDARQHGSVRWQQGYRIDELVRELELFRQELGNAVRAFAESDGTVDLPMLFDELVTTARPGIEAKGLRLSASLDAGLVRVQSSRIRLKQVALNLLSNATKYTREGEVELVIGRCGDCQWFMRVADTGVGIAPSDTERVFREFERAAGDDVPGAGLGLAIVRELCRSLEGEIHFESREGQGTTFEIRFPLDPTPQG